MLDLGPFEFQSYVSGCSHAKQTLTLALITTPSSRVDVSVTASMTAVNSGCRLPMGVKALLGSRNPLQDERRPRREHPPKIVRGLGWSGCEVCLQTIPDADRYKGAYEVGLPGVG